MKNSYCGRVRRFGDNIDTDMIIPSRFLITDNEEELGRHAFEDLAAGFRASVAPGDILVAGRNFGCGSLREHAPLAIRGAGISCIIAESFARTFFRNCLNRGFLAIELGSTEDFRDGDRIQVDIDSGKVKNLTRDSVFSFPPLPPFVLEICGQGGLIPYIQSRMKDKG